MRNSVKVFVAVSFVGGVTAMLLHFTKKKKQQFLEDKIKAVSEQSKEQPFASPAKDSQNKYSAVQIQEDDLHAVDTATDSQSIIPGIAIKFNYNDNAQNISETFFKLEFTPRKASTEPEIVETSILRHVNNPTGARLEKMIHPTDLEKVISICKLTPTKNIDFVSSANGRNLFAIGYSDKKAIKTSAVKKRDPVTKEPIEYYTTPAHNVLWIVSFGTPYDKRPHETAALAALNDVTFKNVAKRLLAAETGGALDLGSNTAFVSDLQKTALLGMLMYRKKRKTDRGRVSGDVTFKSVIDGDENTTAWSKANSFVCLYKGYSQDCAKDGIAPNLLPEIPMSSTIDSRFDSFMKEKFWQLPNLADSGPTSFVHYKNVSAIAPWLGKTESATKTPDAFFRHRNVLVDRAGEVI